MNKKDKFSDIEINLSNEELKKIDSLNKISNAVNKKIKEDDNLLNMSINEVIKLWAKNNIDVLVDLTNFFSNFKKYNKYFDDIDETKMWLDGFKLVIFDIIKIFTKKKRIIFIGITLLLLSFGLYIIQITS
tara:strand:- start:7342 stop:7734 length:393 start_codon:yes stop_codon:yes gene_type:complete